MVEGILVVNLDPPYVGFVHDAQRTAGEQRRMRGALKNCTLQELRGLLLELGAISPQQQWPPRECTIRVPGSYSADALARVGLDSPVATA